RGWCCRAAWLRGRNRRGFSARRRPSSPSRTQTYPQRAGPRSSDAVACLPPRLGVVLPRVSLRRFGCGLIDRALVFQSRHRHSAIALIEIDEPHALRCPANDRDAAGLGPEDHALLRDEHQLLLLEDTGHGHDLSVALGGLDVD